MKRAGTRNVFFCLALKTFLMCSNTVELSAPPRHILFSPLMFTLTCQCGLAMFFFFVLLLECVDVCLA